MCHQRYIAAGGYAHVRPSDNARAGTVLKLVAPGKLKTGHGESVRGRLQAARANRLDKRLVIVVRLIGVLRREVRHRLLEHATGADVPSDHRRIARARVCAREHATALLQAPPGVPVTLILTGATPSFGVRPMSFAAFFVKSILRLPSAGPRSVTVTSVLLPVLRLVTLAVVPSDSLFDAAV